MQDTLQKIVDTVSGAQAAILMGFDGIAVVQALGENVDMDIESIAMEFSFRFIELRTAAESLEMGEISDIAIKAEQATVLVRVLNEEFFVLLMLGDPRHMGHGRHVLRVQASTLAAEL